MGTKTGSYVKEKKVRIGKKSIKGLENDKEIEWGGRKDNVTRKGNNTKNAGAKKKEMNRDQVWHFPGGNSWWELTGTVEARCGTVLWGFPSAHPPPHPTPLTTKGNYLKLYNSTIKARQRGKNGRKMRERKSQTVLFVQAQEMTSHQRMRQLTLKIRKATSHWGSNYTYSTWHIPWGLRKNNKQLTLDLVTAEERPLNRNNLEETPLQVWKDELLTFPGRERVIFKDEQKDCLHLELSGNF